MSDFHTDVLNVVDAYNSLRKSVENRYFKQDIDPGDVYMLQFHKFVNAADASISTIDNPGIALDKNSARIIMRSIKIAARSHLKLVRELALKETFTPMFDVVSSALLDIETCCIHCLGMTPVNEPYLPLPIARML